MEAIVKYESSGLILGYLWGGEKASYPARNLSADTKEELLEKANQGLADGSLDSGMGYDRLIGALLYITTITTVMINGKPYINKETTGEFISELTEDDEKFLLYTTY
jgi:hypothetical protein